MPTHQIQRPHETMFDSKVDRWGTVYEGDSGGGGCQSREHLYRSAHTLSESLPLWALAKLGIHVGVQWSNGHVGLSFRRLEHAVLADVGASHGNVRGDMRGKVR